MGKIGIYGGSFNPPHLGHTLAIREIAKKIGLDLVIVVPAAVPPHKALAAGSPDAETRMEMLRLALAGMDSVEISPMELQRSGPSYTADTVRILHERYPSDQLYLLMGTDMFLSFHEWFEPEVICRYAAIVAAHRSVGDAKKKLQIEQQAQNIRTFYQGNVILAENRFLDVSSTLVRRMLRFDCANSYLDPAVLSMILQNGLYGTSESLQNLPFSKLRDVSLSLHDPKRVPHVIGCCETAARLARRWGADEDLAARAGILHDITKALDRTAQLLLCEKYGIMTNAFEQEHFKLLHAKTGAAVAQRIFGEIEPVTSAIYWHTTGKANMSRLEKILYLADYMEPNRQFDGVETLRSLSETDLDAALLCGFEMSIELLKAEGKPLDTNTIAARDFLLHERTKA